MALNNTATGSVPGCPPGVPHPNDGDGVSSIDNGEA